MQANSLETLTENFPACSIAAYADLSTGVTLLSSCREPTDREVLDKLCAKSALTLGLPNKPALGAMAGDLAIEVGSDAVHVFLRMPDEPNEGVFFRCDPGIDVAQLVQAAQQEISNG